MRYLCVFTCAMSAMLLSGCASINSVLDWKDEFTIESKNVVRRAGFYAILGEVSNNGNIYAVGIWVNASIYPQGNSIPQRETTLAGRTITPPGERAPFVLMIEDEHSVFDRNEIVISIIDKRYLPDTVPHLRVMDTVMDGAGAVTGKIVNDSPKNFSQVRVVVTWYNANGFVVGYDDSGAFGSDVPPHGTVPFRVDGGLRGPFEPPTSFRAVIGGWPS